MFYIDNNVVANGVGCAYYEFDNVAAGNHTVAITTVSGNRESEQAIMTVNVVTGVAVSSRQHSLKKEVLLQMKLVL